MDRSISSASSYNRQISQNSSSLADPEDAPTTSSSTVSENPFYFGPSQSQNGFPQYQNQPHPYDNNGMDSVSNLSVESGHQLQVAVTGSKTIGSSFPLFPIPEHTVAMGGHFENSAPAIPVRAHPPRDDTVMTDNPAFEKVRILLTPVFHIFFKFFYFLISLLGVFRLPRSMEYPILQRILPHLPQSLHPLTAELLSLMWTAPINIIRSTYTYTQRSNRALHNSHTPHILCHCLGRASARYVCLCIYTEYTL